MAAVRSTITAISFIAIILSVVAVGANFAIPGPQGPQGPAGATGAQGPQGPAGTGLAPKTQKLKISMQEGDIIEPFKPEGRSVTGNVFYRWEPNILVVRKGDTVQLTVENPRRTSHSLVLEDFKVNTGEIPGRTQEPDAAKRTITVTFVADKAGVFKFQCGVSFDEAVLKCTPDHGKQVGYLLVLDV